MDSESWGEASQLPQGHVLGGYEVLATIGRGGMARVYRARQQDTGEMVALKVMEPSLLSNVTSRRRFLREGQTAAAIVHPNVVKMLEIGTSNERPFIAMELLSGLDLDTYIRKRGPLPEAETIAIALPLIAGMAAVHKAGVVHRDLKPSNIFLATNSEGMFSPKLLDFGISKLHGGLVETADGATGSREIIGTPAYLAPESLKGSKELGPLSDQYSLGVVVYECLVGRSPYAGNTLLEVLQSLAAGTVRSPKDLRPELSQKLNDVIRRSMSTHPEDRFSDIMKFGRALWALAQEPARAIWASQFGNANYTTPILGTATSPMAWMHGATDLGKATPLSVTTAAKTVSLRTMMLTGLGSFVLCGALAAILVPFGQSENPARDTGNPGAALQELSPPSIRTQILPEALPVLVPTVQPTTPEAEETLALAPGSATAKELQTNKASLKPLKAKSEQSSLQKASKAPKLRMRVRPLKSSRSEPARVKALKAKTTTNESRQAWSRRNEVSELFRPSPLPPSQRKGATTGPNGATIFD